jgi:hypothetical protein
MLWLKLKARGSARLAAFLILGCGAARVQAEDRVVLLEDVAAPASSGLGYALRIQLTGVARVDVRQATETTGVSGRVRSASELAQSEDVLLVVWTEPAVVLADGSREAVLYVVGHKQGRALLEIVRVPGDEGPDVDRTLALKVRELVDEVRHNRAQAAASELMLEPAAEPAPGPVGAPGWGPRVAAGGLVGTFTGSELGQWGARLAAGAARRDGRLRLAGSGQLDVFSEIELSSAAAQVELFELAPGVLAQAQLRQGAIWLGLRAGLSLSVIDAQGQGARGRGEASRLAPAWSAGVEVEVPLLDGIGLVAALELQARFRRQRFSVEGAEVVDLGRLRPLASIALSWSGEHVR